jgi:PAS domain S-box-containing protein
MDAIDVTLTLNERLQYRAQRDLARRSRIGIYAYSVLWAVLAAATDLSNEHAVEVYGPGAVFLLLAVLRHILVARFEPLYRRSPVRWRRAFVAGTLLAAASWGIFCALVVYDHGLGVYALMVLLATAGIASGGMASLAPARTLMPLFLTLLLLPSVPVSVLVAGGPGPALALLFLVYFAFLVLTGRRLHHEYWEALRNEQRIEESGREFAALMRRNELILNSVGEGIYGVDMQGRTTFINPAAARLFGCSPEALLGVVQHPLTHHTHADGTPYPKEECPIYAASRDGNVHHAEQDLFWRLDGSSFPVEYLATPIREGERAVGAVVVFRDITLRRQAESALREAQHQAEEANRGKTQFLAMMGHELRTPLNGVLGITGLLSQTELSATQRDLLRALKGSAESLLVIMNGILEFTEIEAGAVQTRAGDFHLPGAVHTAMAPFLAEAQKRGLSLTEEIDAAVPALLCGDVTRLQQILGKLIGNALKFTRHGSVRLRVLCVPADNQIVCLSGDQSSAAATWLRFEVIDTGVGIPVEQQTKVFETFIQGDSSSTRRYGGIGLGLTIASRLVALLGGRIGVASTPGQGTTFWLHLPFARAVGANARDWIPVGGNASGASQGAR